MKRKKIVSILCAVFLFSFFFASCDMVKIESNDPRSGGGKELTEKERDELEKTGRFLKLVNMPANTQTPNVFSVSVANSSAPVGRLDKNNPVMIFRETDNTCAVYLPLAYNDDGEFLETGFFYTAFTVHVDAVTKYVVDISDRFLVYYAEGRGKADVKNLPSSAAGGTGGVRTLTEKERDELEKTGRFLKLVNMPANTQTPNVFSVSVANSSASIGRLGKNNPVMIFRETDNTCAAYLPLAYNDDTEFLETGFFYTAFTVHVDAVTKYVVDISNRFLVYYAEGRGQADVKNLPSSAAAADDPRFLTVFNLPSSVSIYNFSKVSAYNQAGAVASCKDYSNVLLTFNEGKAAAKIPLQYSSLDQNFTETGVFFVAFDINVDVETRYSLTLDDQVKVTFIDGNGYLDILNIPDKPVPYLTLKGLPLNATKQQVSDVGVYNMAGTVAGCPSNKNITVINDSGFLTFLVPLSSSGGGYFQNSGRFAVSFTINVDIDTQILFSQSDNLILPFSNGSAEIDLNSFFGFFEASLANPNDSSRPVIKSGSSFDVNGNRISVKSDYAVSALAPNSSCVMYLYAYVADSETFYEFSAAAPAYNSKRKGWYIGTRRALWKMVYLNNASPAQFLFKTYIEDDFPQFGTAVMSAADYSQITQSKTLVKSVSGSGNPPAQTFDLEPGIYAVRLAGSGGGSGKGIGKNEYGLDVGPPPGGAGGAVCEIITLNAKTSFTAFTGSGGASAPEPVNSGDFGFAVTRNILSYDVPSGKYDGRETFTCHTLSSLTTPLGEVVTVFNVTVDTRPIKTSGTPNAGGGGGGGGSGSFLYSSGANGNYLLTAGGGGGGSGNSGLTPGGAGGAGGAVGPGAGGGSAGSFSQSSSYGVGNFRASGGGGAGGGLNGGAAGGGTAGSVLSSLPSNGSHSGGAGAASNSAFSFPSFAYLKYSTFGWASESSPVPKSASDHSSRVATLRTTSSFSGNSGSGGSTAAIYYPSYDSQAWRNTNGAGGAGGKAPAVRPYSISGGFTAENGPSNSAPGEYQSYWNRNDKYSYTSNITVTLKETVYGQPGSDGGNNRNASKGGGAAAGEAGSINVYKIYSFLTR